MAPRCSSFISVTTSFMQATHFVHGSVIAMPEHGRVTDGEIMSGFKSLLDAMELGFAKINARIDALANEMRSSIASLEQRTLRRFDAVDDRFDHMDARFKVNEACMNDIRSSVQSIDGRLTALEARA